MLQFLEETETCSNSEADNFHHRPKARKPIYRARQSQGPSRPHISSVTSNFKERGDKIDSVRLACLARPASCISSSVCVSSRWRLRRGPSGAPLAPQRRRWRGIYGWGPDPASAFFRDLPTFFRTPDSHAKCGGSRNLSHHPRDRPARFLSSKRSIRPRFTALGPLLRRNPENPLGGAHTAPRKLPQRYLAISSRLPIPMDNPHGASVESGMLPPYDRGMTK